MSVETFGSSPLWWARGDCTTNFSLGGFHIGSRGSVKRCWPKLTVDRAFELVFGQ